MIRSNAELPSVPKDYLDGPFAPDKLPVGEEPIVRLASTLDYDGATNRLTLTRGDGTVQQFPANNNSERNSRGRWENGTFNYHHHKDHPDDAPDSAYGSHGIYVFRVPGGEGVGVHSGRASVPDGLGRSGVDHATKGCIRTTDEGVAAIRDALSAGDPLTHITVRNNR